MSPPHIALVEHLLPMLRVVHSLTMLVLFAHPMQVADATFAMEGAINAAVEKWYTSAGWQGNKVGPRPRTARPPPPVNVVVGTLLATLHEVRAVHVWRGVAWWSFIGVTAVRDHEGTHT